jgi:hypothetical protein
MAARANAGIAAKMSRLVVFIRPSCAAIPAFLAPSPVPDFLA